MSTTHAQGYKTKCQRHMHRAIRQKGKSEKRRSREKEKNENALAIIGLRPGHRMFFDVPKVKWGLKGPLLRY